MPRLWIKWALGVGGALVLIMLTVVLTLILSQRRGRLGQATNAATQIGTNASQPSAGASRKILYWWDPMLGASSISDKPGKSAMGMDLEPVYEDELRGGANVEIDSTVVQNMGIRTASVARGPLPKTVRTVGLLRAPEPGLREINLKINGWIDKLYVNQEGMHVQSGEILFDLYSPDVQVAQVELISAVKALRTLDAAAGAQVCQEAQALVASAKQKLRLWDLAPQDVEVIAQASEPPRTVPFRSPVDGEIIEKTVIEGSAVQAGMKLMRIEDRSKMWLDAQVYDEQMPVVVLGQRVEAVVDGISGKTFTGLITFIYPNVDPMTRTISVRVTLDNPEMILKPGMYATANILTPGIADAIQIPREAVIDTGVRQIVFVVQSEGHFAPRNVRMGVLGDDDQVQILQGLAPGETVVTSGEFLLDVESRTKEAIDKLRGGETPASKPAVEADSLVITHCTMKKADWLQIGDTVANPYFGSKMPSCGSVTKKLVAPPKGTLLYAVLENYLRLAKAFDADALDSDGVAALKTAADQLPGEQYASLRQCIGILAEAKDLEAARTAFESVSAELIRVLDSSAK